MKLVIEIPEEIKVAITRMGLLRIPDEMQKKVDSAIQRGIPLPKGHGRLIDEKEVKKMIEEAKVNSEHSKTFAENIIKFAPTIVEAAKEQEDGTKD